MSDEYSGFAALGDLVTGGAQHRAEGAFYKGLRESATGYKALEEARQERAKSMAREALPDAIKNAGLQHPDLAAAILGMADGQPNLSTLTSGYQDLGEMELARQQEDALRAGNIRLANQLQAVRKDTAYEPVRELGGNLIPSGVELGDPAFQVQPLPQTKATVDLRHAQQQKALHPPAPRASSGGGGSNSDAKVLAEARAAIAAGADVAAVRKRLHDRGYGALARKL